MLRRFAKMFSNVSPIVIQLILDIAGSGCFAFALTVREPITQAQAKTKWGSIYGELESIFDSRAPADAPIELFPFEPAYFDAAGMSCTFVSHPVPPAAARPLPLPRSL